MPYTANPIDETQPADVGVQALTGPSDLRAIKAYVGKMPPLIKSIDYTITPNDRGKLVRHPTSDAVARIFTVQDHATLAWPDGSMITVQNGNGAGNVTIASPNTLRLAGSGTTGSKTLAPNGIATGVWDLAALTWTWSGVGLT
jgi:hypothetical protein